MNRAIAALMGFFGGNQFQTEHKVPDTTIEDYLRRRKRTMEQEYERIKQGKSVLSRSQRNKIIRTIEGK